MRFSKASTSMRRRSAPNSLFLHADRPLISENGTSSLLHELAHVVTRIRGERFDDWIAEGIAEFYSVELQRRAGGISDSRYARTRQGLREWSQPVRSLRVKQSTGPVTARAVLLFQDLDKEIRARTKDAKNLDDVVRALMGEANPRVSLAELRAATERVIGGRARTLDSPLLARAAP
jgi:predicted metalloprotease with PDZ domain